MAQAQHPDLTKIIAFEQGELDFDETVELFQELINNGMAWTLQGSYGRTAARLIEYGRTAARLIEAGYCQPAT